MYFCAWQFANGEGTVQICNCGCPQTLCICTTLVSFTFAISGIIIMHLLHDSYIFVVVSFTIAISDKTNNTNIIFNVE